MNNNIVIVEDNDAVREGFAHIINVMSDYQVVADYDNAEAAIKNLLFDDPGIIIMDIGLPGMNGIDAIKLIRKKKSDVEILINSVHENNEVVFDALCAGASGYLTKNSPSHKLIDALQEVSRGGAPMSSNIAKMVVNSFKKSIDSPLSARETEVLELLSKGKSYSMIADQLFITKETAKTHIKNIYSKLQVNSKSAAIEKATKQRLI